MQLSRYGIAFERLGKRYRLISPLGSGGMADVCLAVDEQKNNEVAVKVLRPDQLDEELLGRFMKEASLVAGWNHPNIIRIDGEVKWEVLNAKNGSLLPYIVMEYIRGGNLRERLVSDQPYPFPKTLRLFTQVCSAVQYAHEHEIIHRDIKPENILFRQPPNGSEDVVLSDFGMAVSLSATHHTFSHGGTPSYMAPEQWRGKAQPASDIYALGVLLYRLCTGQFPFPSQFAQLAQAPQPPNPSSINTALPKDLDEIILMALSVDPAQRFSSAQIFSERLQSVANAVSSRSSFPKRDGQTTNSGVPIVEVQPSPPSPEAEKRDTVDKSKDVNNGALAVNNRISTQADQEKGKPQAFPSSSNGIEPDNAVSSSPPLPITNAPEPVEEDAGADPGLIDLRPVPHGRGRSTVDLRGTAAAGAMPAARPVETPPSRSATRRRNGGGAAVAGAASGLALGAGAAAATGAPTAASGGATVAGTVRPAPVPPQLGTPPGRGRQGNPPPRRGRLLLLFLLLLLLLLISGSVCVFANPGILPSLIIRPISGVYPDSRSILTTITVTPDSKEVKDSYVMQAVTTQPNADQLQVSMRNLNVAPDAQTKTVAGTGRGEIPAVAAKGRLTFLNGSFSAPYTVASGTVVSAANGVSVVTEQPATIPAGVPGGANGSTSVPAHAVTAGTAGNLDQGAINKSCCNSSAFIFVRNDVAFTGGVDAKSYTFVGQGDVDAVAGPLENTASQQASTQFKQQLKPNEKLVVGPNCNSNVQIPAGTVGDQGRNIASTTVTVKATCTGAAYDREAAQAIAKDRLQKKATIDPGAGYALVGNIVPDVTVSKVNPDSISLLVNARGIWAYQFESAKQQELAKQLAGKKLMDAQALLNGQHGSKSWKIDMKDDNGTLPNDPAQITFNVQKVQGDSEGSGGSDGGGSGNGNDANPNGAPTTVPGQG